MKSLIEYLIPESEYDDLGGLLGQVKDIGNLLTAVDKISNLDSSDKRYITRIINKLVDDADVQNWYSSSSNSELELRRILNQKLTRREARYMDDICKQMLHITDNDPDIITNAMMRLISDPDIIQWHDGGGDRFKLYGILVKKLDSKERPHIDEITDKLMNMI